MAPSTGTGGSSFTPLRGQKRGARTTYTFDRDLRGLEGFTLLS